jgi:hypothetical protein
VTDTVQCHGAAVRQSPRLEVADVLLAHGAQYAQSHSLSSEQQRAMRDIMRCRTAALGGHLDRCTACGDEQPAYNSCRNRHCPKCQALAQARWVEGQMERVLPVRCFHVVFTLPAQLRPLARRHPREIYDLLFRSAADTLLTLGRTPRHLGAELGITAVLHTWNRQLEHHPHVHCICTAGGLSLDGTRWIASRPNFLIRVEVMGQLMRGKFLDGLMRLRRSGRVTGGLCSDEFSQLVESLYDLEWNVYSKAPFAGPKYIFRYLAHYTHRTGISNSRLVAMDEHGVTFRTHGDDTVTLPPQLFIKRFLNHVLPHGFVKIRHYGLMANGHAVKRREQARQLLATRSQQPDGSPEPPHVQLRSVPWSEALALLSGVDLRVCRRCGKRAVVRVPLPRPRPVLTARVRAPPVAEVAA